MQLGHDANEYTFYLKRWKTTCQKHSNILLMSKQDNKLNNWTKKKNTKRKSSSLEYNIQ